MRVLLHYDQPDLFIDLIEQGFQDLEVACCRDYAGLPAMLDDFQPDALFCIKFENRAYPRAAVLATSSLRWVSVGGAGVDHLTPWDPARLTVTNGAGVASEVMGDYALGAILNLSLELPRFIRQQARREWTWRHISPIAGKCVTVVGLGNVGRAVAKRAAALGLKVVGTRANPQPTDNLDRVYGSDELHRALAEGDFVVVASPLLPQTHHLLDAAAFDAMKDGVCFIDISRGGVTDSRALLAALEGGKVKAAQLDVFEVEPIPADSPFWTMENVIVTPHSCGIFEGWERRTFERFCENLRRFMNGEALGNVVDPKRGY